MKKFLTIDLFDEVVEDLIDSVNEVYQRISSKWLGELRIPISTICTNQRVSLLITKYL
jgi:coiled-coil and C2 domain-containing protein 2A